MPDELAQLRNDIKDLTVSVAVLSQKIEDMDFPVQPCTYHTEHIKLYHTNTVWDQAKQRAVSTLVQVIVLAVAGYIWYGFAKDVNAASQRTQKVEESK